MHPNWNVSLSDATAWPYYKKSKRVPPAKTMNPFDDKSAGARPLRACLKVPVADLRPGMFVLEPDCGWLNTPFLLEGLLIRQADEIDTLARLTGHVTIDPRRSMMAAFAGEYEYLIYEDSPPDQVARHPGRIATAASETMMAETQPLFKDYLSRTYGSDLALTRPTLAEKITAWWRRVHLRIAGLFLSRNAMEAHPLPTSARPDYIPADIPLVIYREPEPTSTSLPAARAACIAVEKSLSRIVSDIALNGTSNPENLQEAANTLVDNMVARPSTMIWLAKMRAMSKSRYQQALTVSVYLTALGRQIGFPREQLADLATIGLLLDVGKMAIGPELLDKAEPLNDTEKDVMRGHVVKSLDLVTLQGGLPDTVTTAIAEHHERMDGSGYPKGLTGNEISIYGKMAAIADSFAAMTTPRPYAPTLTAYDAIRQLFQEADTRLYAPLVEQFVQAIGIFPVGTLIELSSGEVAIIVQHNDLRRLEPKVLVLTDADKGLLDDPRELDMLQHNAHATTVMRIVRGLVEGAYGIDFRKYYLNRR